MDNYLSRHSHRDQSSSKKVSSSDLLSRDSWGWHRGELASRYWALASVRDTRKRWVGRIPIHQLDKAYSEVHSYLPKPLLLHPYSSRAHTHWPAFRVEFYRRFRARGVTWLIFSRKDTPFKPYQVPLWQRNQSSRTIGIERTESLSEGVHNSHVQRRSAAVASQRDWYSRPMGGKPVVKWNWCGQRMCRDVHFFHQSKAHFRHIQMSNLNISSIDSVRYYSDVVVVSRKIHNISPSHERFPSIVTVTAACSHSHS